MINMKKIKHDLENKKRLYIKKTSGYNGYLNELPYAQDKSNKQIHNNGSIFMKPVIKYFHHLAKHQIHYNESRLLSTDGLQHFTNNSVLIGGIIANYKICPNKKFQEARFYILLVNVVGYKYNSFTLIAHHLWIDLSKIIAQDHLDTIGIGDFVSFFGTPTMYHGKLKSVYSYKAGLKNIRPAHFSGYPIIKNNMWKSRCESYNHHSQYLVMCNGYINIGSELRESDKELVNHYNLIPGISGTHALYCYIKCAKNMPLDSSLVYWIDDHEKEHCTWVIPHSALADIVYSSVFHVKLGDKAKLKNCSKRQLNNLARFFKKVGTQSSYSFVTLH